MKMQLLILVPVIGLAAFAHPFNAELNGTVLIVREGNLAFAKGEKISGYDSIHFGEGKKTVLSVTGGEMDFPGKSDGGGPVNRFGTEQGGYCELAMSGGRIKMGHVSLGPWGGAFGRVKQSGGTFETGELWFGWTGAWAWGGGEWTLEGGELKADRIFIRKGKLELKGGTLSTFGIANRKGSFADSGSTLVLNGGTFRATSANDSFIDAALDHVYVGSGGTVIDNGGFDIAIHAKLANASGAEGELAFSGKGVTTLAGAEGTFSGDIKVLSGTLDLGGQTIDESRLSIEEGAVVRNGRLKFESGKFATLKPDFRLGAKGLKMLREKEIRRRGPLAVRGRASELCKKAIDRIGK